ncbi:MAG: 2-phospho-L-lactate guanylyltransferase [Acidimicrobiales bacterium]
MTDELRPAGDDHPAAIPLAVVVPVKAFELAKGRLADTLDPDARAELARRMTAGVLKAADPLPRWVVCEADDVARWAIDAGASVIRQDRPGLNPGVTEAVAELGARGVQRVIVAHGDLPLAASLAWVGDFDGVTVVPDRRGDGTNVLAVPTGTDFTFAYGRGSAEAHWAEAERCGLAARMVHDESLGWDVDLPDDLTVFEIVPARSE